MVLKQWPSVQLLMPTTFVSAQILELLTAGHHVLSSGTAALDIFLQAPRRSLPC